MWKTLVVAWREFLTTALTRGFIIGVLLPPVLLTAVFSLMPLLINQQPPRTEGRVAIIDRSGLVAERVAEDLSIEKMEERRKRQLESVKAAAEQAAPGMGAGRALERGAAQMPPTAKLTVEVLAADADAEAAKKEIPTTSSRADILGTNPRLALAVVPEGAVRRPEGTRTFERFELLSAPTLDVEVKSEISRAIDRSIVDARLKAEGLDVDRVRSLIANPVSESLTVTERGERRTNPMVQILVPGAFLFLTWIAVFTAGQYLLTTTIEEKGNRIMEVLLSAVSPMQLMVGKILGQMGVGMVILGLYAGAGIAALIGFAMADVINPMQIVYMVIYFFIAFAMIACLMAAVGSAVSELREAQSLMGPIMIVLVIPMMLWFPILRNPNSGFATVCSFIPPISPFIMVLRLAGPEPVPTWQIPASIAVGLLAVAAFAWAAAKIFRIGVLMYGKPPNLGTLWKWVRMA